MPPLTVAPLSRPPAEIVSLPPTSIVMAVAVPPASTVPISVLLSVRPLLVWPELAVKLLIPGYPDDAGADDGPGAAPGTLGAAARRPHGGRPANSDAALNPAFSLPIQTAPAPQFRYERL